MVTRRQVVADWLRQWEHWLRLWARHLNTRHNATRVTGAGVTYYTYDCEFCRMRRHV